MDDARHLTRKRLERTRSNIQSTRQSTFIDGGEMVLAVVNNPLSARFFRQYLSISAYLLLLVVIILVRFVFFSLGSAKRNYNIEIH